MLAVAALVVLNGVTLFTLAIIYFALVIAMSVRTTCNGGCSCSVNSFTEVRTFFASLVVYSMGVRLVTFGSLTVLSFLNVQLFEALAGIYTPPNSNYDVLSKTISVLFNLGDFSALSCWFLLAVLWIEAQTLARDMLDNNQMELTRRTMVAYIVCHAILLLGQLGSYIAFFYTKTDTVVVLETIYGVLAFVNLGAPLVAACMWCYAQCQLGGFPYRDEDAKRKAGRIGWTFFGWTVGRFIYGALPVIAADEGVLYRFEAKPWVFGVLVSAFFIIGEVVPYIAVVAQDLRTLVRDNLDLDAALAEALGQAGARRRVGGGGEGGRFLGMGGTGGGVAKGVSVGVGGGVRRDAHAADTSSSRVDATVLERREPVRLSDVSRSSGSGSLSGSRLGLTGAAVGARSTSPTAGSGGSVDHSSHGVGGGQGGSAARTTESSSSWGLDSLASLSDEEQEAVGVAGRAVGSGGERGAEASSVT